MSDAGRITSERLITEWESLHGGRVTGERLLVEWASTPAGRLTTAQLLVEWESRLDATFSGLGSLSATGLNTVPSSAALAGLGTASARPSAILVLKSGTADLNLGGIFNRGLAEGTETAGSITVSLAGQATSFGYGITRSDIPGLQGAPGDYTVKVNVTTGNNNVYLAVGLARLNAAGSTQASSSLTAEQQATAGVKTFAFAGLNLGTWQAGDRLLVQYRFRNNQNMANSAVIQTGTVNATVATPWTVPQGKGSFAGAGSSTASASVILPITVAGIVAGTTTVAANVLAKIHPGIAHYSPAGERIWFVRTTP